MDKQLLEYYHDSGLMPDWAYYQQNGKSAQENFIEQHKKMQKRFEEQRRQEQQDAALENYLDKMVEDKLGDCLEKALDNLFKGFK